MLYIVLLNAYNNHMKLYCLPCWCINCNCEKIIYLKVPYVKALGFDAGYLFQSLCSSLCATLSQCPSPSYLPGQYMCPYSILHLRKKKRDGTNSHQRQNQKCYLNPLPFTSNPQITKSYNSWYRMNFWFFSIHIATSTWVHLTRISSMNYCNHLRYLSNTVDS